MADSVAELQKWFPASFREMSNQRLSPIDVSSTAIPRSPVSSSLVAMVQELTREADNIRRLSRFRDFRYGLIMLAFQQISTAHRTDRSRWRPPPSPAAPAAGA